MVMSIAEFNTQNLPVSASWSDLGKLSIFLTDAIHNYKFLFFSF